MLSKTGDLVKANDPVVEFDSTDQEFRLKESKSEARRSQYEGGAGQFRPRSSRDNSTEAADRR